MGRMINPRKASLRPDLVLTSEMASVRNLQRGSEVWSHAKWHLLGTCRGGSEVELRPKWHFAGTYIVGVKFSDMQNAVCQEPAEWE